MRSKGPGTVKSLNSDPKRSRAGMAIRRAAEGAPAFASRMLWFELVGVLAVGTLSLLVPDWFPDPTVG